MVYEKINNEEIWSRFFSQAVQCVEYNAFVHCKSEAQCRENIRSQHVFTIIPSVETSYCVDLVGGMNALILSAISSGGTARPNDKFVFLSDSTLPVKPFSQVYQRLTVDNGDTSDFCIFPRSQWAEVTQTYPHEPLKMPAAQVAVKHHQWIVLSRAHAELSLQRTSQYRDLMQQFQLNTQGNIVNTGCLDEFWHFRMLFSELDLRSTNTHIALPGFTGGGLNTGDTELQGQCDTFLHWTPRNSGNANNMTRLGQELLNDPGTDLTPADELRPSMIQRVSKTSLAAMRNSWFLFTRKVEDGAVFSGCVSLDEAFDSLVFADPPRELLGAEPTWPGQGEWLDNRQASVTLTGIDGGVKLLWVGNGQNAKGSYCGDRLNVVFSNGYKASAILTSGGTRLLWSNGVSWARAAPIVR